MHRLVGGAAAARGAREGRTKRITCEPAERVGRAPSASQPRLRLTLFVSDLGRVCGGVPAACSGSENRVLLGGIYAKSYISLMFMRHYVCSEGVFPRGVPPLFSPCSHRRAE